VFNVIDAPARGVHRVRPRMRDVGFVHLVAGLVLLAALGGVELSDCAGNGVQVITAAPALAALVALAGVAMVIRVPRATAVAPALAAGAALSLVGGAASGWIWVSGQPCTGNVLDREVVTLLLVSAASVAVLATALWLLYSRDELEPWYATRGVVVATASAVTVLVTAIGVTVLNDGGTPIVASALAFALPWSIVVAATGWLRPSPAVAVVVPAVLQAGWLLLA
jgi:hypothetical protein